MYKKGFNLSRSVDARMVPFNFNPSLSHPLYFIRKGLLKAIEPLAVQFQGRLLDFGCGEKPYRSLFTNVQEYVGLDYASEGHDHSGEGVDVYYDGKTIPFPDQHFDGLFSSEVFEHVFGLPEILPEINRVLKPGAQLLITTPFAWEEHEVPVDYARYTRFALQDLLSRNGFTVTQVKKNGHFISTLHQLLVVYLYNEWLHKIPLFSRWTFFHKLVRQVLVPGLNMGFYVAEPFWPKSDKLYLNTVLLARKNQA